MRSAFRCPALRRAVLWACLSTSLAPAAWAAPPQPAPQPQTVIEGAARKELLDRIQAKYASVSVMQASFVQKVGSALYGEDEQQGTLVLQRPGKMRWNFADGRQYVSDGKVMWVYTPADKQVIKISDIGEQAATADAVLQSMHRLEELFRVTITASDPATGHTLLLEPKEGNDQFKKLQLELAPDLSLRRVRLTDAFDATTTLSFSGVVLGGAVAPDVFTFVVPPGVAVIDSGG